ncbi:hypothetical protein [Sorangium cellulosum]|uniref:hypothetical protein n=1 Tax=Sorangium cellulosum TaxID=56 RepID=UPI0013319391
MVDRRDSIRRPGVAGARWLDDQQFDRLRTEIDAGCDGIGRALPDQAIEATIEVHAGGQDDRLFKDVAAREHPPPTRACKLDRAAERANRLVLRAWICIVATEERATDKHATAIVQPIRGEVLKADGLRRWFALARRCERALRFTWIDRGWGGPTTDRGERKDKQQDIHGI